MRAFEYNRPSSLEEAGRLLQVPDVGSHILAGGTDLLVRIKRGEIIPQKVISLRDVPGLSFVRTLSDGGVTIGAMTPLSTLEISEVLLKKYSALPKAAAKRPCFAVYLKACRSRMDIALVGVGLRVLFEPNGEKCREVRLVLGAVGPVPIRVRSAEQEIVGSPLDDRVIERVSQLARGAASPISDIRASAGYRLSLVEALTHKALTAARLRVREGGTH